MILHRPKKLNKYQKFILDNNLYLNYDFGYYYDKQSLSDNFFPNLIEDVRSIDDSKASPMSKKVYFTFQVFNQIVEDFTTSRYIFHKALSIKCKAIDNSTNYVYTFDYTRHSLKYGMLKSVFSSLYSCLDKIAHQIKYNYSSSSPDINRIDIYFDWFTTDEFKKIILDHESYQLLALHNLALDFKTNSQYYKLNKLRNRITHSFVNIFEDGFEPENLEYYETTINNLIKDIHSLFIIVKSALLYSTIAIRLINKEKDAGVLIATLQHEIY